MSDRRGIPLLSRPPPEYTANEPSCRKCNKEFNMLFARSRRCNHCGYSYCHSCSDFQALMPRRGEVEVGSSVGYDPLPVCAFCIEMLQITASGKGQLKQLPMAKLKKYAKAYGIDVAGVLEKDEFIDRLVAARAPDGCLPSANENYYRKYSVPNRTEARPRGIFTRAMDAMSGDTSSPSQTPPPPPPPPSRQPQRQQYHQYPQYTQYQPRQRTTSGPSRYVPPGDPRAQQQYRPQQQASHGAHPPPQYAPPSGYPPRPTQPTRPNDPHPPTQQSSRPRAASASSTPGATTPARPVVIPGIDDLLWMSDSQLSALSIGSLKEILFRNHVHIGPVVEKSDLVTRVKTLLEQERVERERKAREEEEERDYEEQMRRSTEASLAESSQAGTSRTMRAARVEDADDEGEDDRYHEEYMSFEPAVTPPTPPAPEAMSSSPPKRVATPPLASTLTPKAQSMASRLERTGLCVICQDEEANIAIVDCGHLAMCRGCSDLIMSSTRECPLCRTRIVTESRLLRIFKS